MRRQIWWVGVALVTVMLVGGCGGVLTQKVNEGGKVERVRLDTGTKWSLWDHSGAREDDKSLLLKKEMTF